MSDFLYALWNGLLISLIISFVFGSVGGVLAFFLIHGGIYVYVAFAFFVLWASITVSFLLDEHNIKDKNDENNEI